MRISTPGDVPWTAGSAVIETMAPEWRTNLGPTAEVERAYRLYRQRNYLSTSTTRRFDLINLGPGYSDATAAYHDTVEESLILSGSCIIDGEGVFEAGDYFWRPPGWVHRARTETGFTALLSLEGQNLSEDSRQASRLVVEPDELGHRVVGDLVSGHRRERVTKINVSDVQPQGDDGDIPLPWRGLPGEISALRVLGRNAVSGACTVVLQLDADSRWSGRRLDGLDAYVFVLSGEAYVGEHQIEEEAFIQFEAGETAPDLKANRPTSLFIKTNVPGNGETAPIVDSAADTGVSGWSK